MGVLCIKEACMYIYFEIYLLEHYGKHYLAMVDNSNGENVKVYCMIKIGTWYNSAFIRGFFSNPLKSLVRFWYYKALLRNNILLVLDCGPTYW